MSTATLAAYAPTPQPRLLRSLWKALLAERGLSDSTIAHFGFAPRGQGWQYPVANVLRWKAFDSAAVPKYLWLPGKPDSVRFYDADGRLRNRIAAADGALWLASGEADVWAFWEGGIPNATCMFDGEARHIPHWFRAELRYLRVTELHIVPDRDEAGDRFAIKVRRALRNTAMRLVTHQLPFEWDSKGDVGRFLLRVGAMSFKDAITALPELALADDLPVDDTPPVYVQQALPLLLGDGVYDLYERWCVEVVEAAALRVWPISPPDHKGFSKDIHCPFHEDRHPSAGWNYNTHGIHCFACGAHSAKAVAALLNTQTWEEFRAQRQAAQRPHLPSRQGQ